MPLIAVAAEESVEMLEAETGGPQVEWTCLTRHPVRHIVHLAEPCGVVAVLSENSRHRTGALGHQRIIARIAGRELGDVSAGNRMVVPSGNQSCSSWRAQRRRVVHVVTKAAVCNALEIGGLYGSAKRAAGPEAHVVCQDQQDIGGTRRRLDAFRKVRNRTLQGAFDLPLKRWFWSRQYRVCSGICQTGKRSRCERRRRQNE